MIASAMAAVFIVGKVIVSDPVRRIALLMKLGLASEFMVGAGGDNYGGPDLSTATWLANAAKLMFPGYSKSKTMLRATISFPVRSSQTNS